MNTTNCQPADCPCFCPSAALPLAVALVPEGGPAVVIQVTIFGTQPFQVSIETNPLFPIAQVPIIASVQMVAGNTLLITTGIPAPNETLGNYAATIRVCNPCGELIINVPIEVVADLTPIVSDCTLAQGVWTFENRTPTVGDTILAFTPAGCRALLPPGALDICAALQSFPLAVPTPVDTVFGQQAGACRQFSVSNLVTPTSVCAALNALGPLGGPLAPTDEFIILRAGGCALATLTDVSVGFDICAALQNLPNAVVQPTAVFYGQQGGNCFEFAVADLGAVIGAFPILAANGSCAAPIYSFAASPDSGMFYDGAAVVIGDDNCADFIEIGASINVTATSGAITITQAGTDDIVLVASGGNIFVTGSDVTINSSIPLSGNILLNSGGQLGLTSAAQWVAVSGGEFQFDTSGGPGRYFFSQGGIERLRFDFSGAWGLGGAIFGVAGQQITSNGPGLPPTWQAAGGVVFPLLAPSGSCAAPSYAFTASPDSGMFYTGTAVRISDDSCTDFIEVGASITLQTASTLAAIAATTASITGTLGVTVTSTGGSITVQSGLGGGASALLTARAASGFNSAFVRATDHITQPNVSIHAEVFLGAVTDLDVRTTGIQGSTTGPNGMLWNSTNHTFRTGPGLLQELLVLGPGLGVFAVGNFLRIDRAASGSPPTLFAMGNPDANVSINITPKGTGNILTPNGSCALPMYSFTASPDSGMFYDPAGVGSVVIGDDNCADFIAIGASINIVSAASTVTLQAGGVGALGGSLSLFNGAGGVGGLGGNVTINAGTAGAGTSGAILIIVGASGMDGGAAVMIGGSGALPSGNGGATTVHGGDGRGAGAGGNLDLRGGPHNSNGQAGNIFIIGGEASGAGVGGQTYVSGGRSTGGNAGALVLAAGEDFGAGAQGEIWLQVGSPSVTRAVFNTLGLDIGIDNGYRANNQTSGAGASVGTLNNAPSAGDPAFWLRVVINGVNRFIPAWA